MEKTLINAVKEKDKLKIAFCISNGAKNFSQAACYTNDESIINFFISINADVDIIVADLLDRDEEKLALKLFKKYPQFSYDGTFAICIYKKFFHLYDLFENYVENYGYAFVMAINNSDLKMIEFILNEKSHLIDKENLKCGLSDAGKICNKEVIDLLLKFERKINIM